MLPLLVFLAFIASGCGQTTNAAAIEKGTVRQQASIEWSAPEMEVPPLLEEPSEPLGALAGKTICVDPGHCVTSEKQQERVSPKSEETKTVFGGGTTGKNQTEEQLNLKVGFMLKEALNAEGANVLMTREVSEIAINNIERAQIGNRADCCIRIHADGVDDPSVHGISVLVPSGDLLGTPGIITPSRALGELMLKHLVEQTGAKDRGVVNRSDLVGFNWSEVPVVLVEMGFMTNQEEDALMGEIDYQRLIVNGITEAIIEWFYIQDGL